MPKTAKIKNTQLHLRLSEDELKQVREIAKAKNISVSKLVLTSVIQSK